ncbi:MAG: response regulator [Trichocoleus desertorum ATA4-8-CV12]|jgi:CheY-like chemotaxis protein|nr:response regulator [Trichocoleus desertorum ATA4-8-CV12]
MNKIAILDDDEHWCFSVQRFLRGSFEVSAFHSISELIPKVSQYDLVIVDFSIPPTQYQENIDGCEIIQRIKQGLSHPPILVLATAFISKNSLELGRQLCPEADFFIAKDAGLEFILTTVKQLLRTQNSYYSSSLNTEVTSIA